MPTPIQPLTLSWHGCAHTRSCTITDIPPSSYGCCYWHILHHAKLSTLWITAFTPLRISIAIITISSILSQNRGWSEFRRCRTMAQTILAAWEISHWIRFKNIAAFGAHMYRAALRSPLLILRPGCVNGPLRWDMLLLFWILSSALDHYIFHPSLHYIFHPSQRN